MSTPTLSLAELNKMDKSSFVSRLGWIYEHSPWVAEKAWEHRPFADLEALHAAMFAVVLDAPEEKRLALIQGHPDLAGRVAKLEQLTDASHREQIEAGLDKLTPDLATELDHRNNAYREKFGFPFVICARLNDVNMILASMAVRLKHDPAGEVALALEEISKIARLRLIDIIS